MKFRNGSLIIHIYSKQMYLVKSSNKVGNYEVNFCNPEYHEDYTMWLFDFNMGEYVIASDDDIIKVLADRLKSELIINYSNEI